MVKLGKMMWNAKVNPAWMRSRRTGSRFIARLPDAAGPCLRCQYSGARRNRAENARLGPPLPAYDCRGQVADSRRSGKVHGLWFEIVLPVRRHISRITP